MKEILESLKKIIEQVAVIEKRTPHLDSAHGCLRLAAEQFGIHVQKSETDAPAAPAPAAQK